MDPGQIVDQRFVLDRLVARGGMGAVYHARDRETDAEIAFKVWNGIGDNSDRFEREARVLERLAHPAIVRYVAHGATSDGELYLAMEWLEGVDLAARLATVGVTIAQGVTAIARAADALASAHAMGVVHRDLKPSNLFLVDSEPAKLKVLDFGVARFRDANDSGGHRPETRGGVVLGTPDYMAPEQARGDETIDARADVFALGAVLFECLTGRSAFSANDLVAVLARVMLEEVPRVRTLRPEVPAALDELVARMLEKDPAARPASASEVATRLRAIGPLEGDREDVASSRPRSPTLRRELQLVSLVAVRAGAVDARSTTHTLAAGSAPGMRSRQARVARTFGARTGTLDDGTTTLIVRHGAAIDRAPHAARCALALTRTLAEGEPTAIVTGSCVIDGDRLDSTELTRRAQSLVLGARGAIRIDDVTRGLLDRRFDVEHTAEEGWVLRGARDDRDARDDLKTRVNPRLPFVGRARELSVVASLFDECERESIARVVVLTGPAGVGKSRLCAEIVRSMRGMTFVARGEATACSTPLSLVRMLLGAATLDGETPEVERSLGTLLRQSRDPVTLVIDDLHHGDLPSIQLLDRCLRDLRDRPILLIAFARPELARIFPACFADRGRQELPLGGLPPASLAELVRHQRGSRVTEEAIARAAARCEGNPLVLEAILTEDEAGATRVGTTVAQGRLDALDADARRILRVASELPEPFSAASVREVLVTVSELETILDELVEQGLLAIVNARDEDRGGERRFAFHSPLVREAASATLPEEDRAFIVGRAARPGGPAAVRRARS